ncbi:MAG: YbhB/YbcL family Raf kinase inhibitor-like protein [Rickettsiales bacterium]|nr:YbhB/YbcL family Raf kinase inhibitor-like protein [Rickettsiales bacterium]
MKKFLSKTILVAAICLPISASATNSFMVYSPDFKDGDNLVKSNEFNGFGCTGKNIAPEIRWKHAPTETKSFALTVYDPDAPTGSGWWHFVAYNIPAKDKFLDAEKISAGTLLVTGDVGSKAFMGPCPPVGHGKHHYIFTVYALDVGKLDLPETASPALAGYMMNQHKIASAAITGIYERK